MSQRVESDITRYTHGLICWIYHDVYYIYTYTKNLLFTSTPKCNYRYDNNKWSFSTCKKFRKTSHFYNQFYSIIVIIICSIIVAITVIIRFFFYVKKSQLILLVRVTLMCYYFELYILFFFMIGYDNLLGAHIRRKIVLLFFSF